MTHAFPSGLCPLCGGVRVAGRIMFSADLGDSVIVIRGVPATVCEQCGEEWIDDATAADLELRSDAARKRGAQVEVMALP